MALVYKDRVKQVCSAPTTTNPFDFTGAATATGYQTFVAALADGDTVIYGAEDADGDWEVGLGTWTEASDQLARTTILASSNAGSAETFSGDTTVYITADARTITQARIGTLPFFQGGVLEYVDSDTVQITAGKGVVNGELLEWSSAIGTGNIAGIAADTLYHIYLYNNSGTAAIEASTTAPVWDGDLGYYKKTGDTRRYVGSALTKTSSAEFLLFTCSQTNGGRDRQLVIADDGALSTATATLATWTNTTWATASKFSMTSKVPSVSSRLFLSILNSNTATAPAMSGGAISSKDLNGLTPTFIGDLYVRITTGVASQGHLLAPTWLPYAAEYWHRSSASTNTCTLRCHGWEWTI